MKKKIPALIVAMSISQTAFAAFDVTPTKDGIKVSGVADGNTIMFVYSPSVTPLSLDNNAVGEAFSLKGKIVVQDSFDEGETVNKVYDLPDDAVFGEYSVYIKSAEGIAINKVSYVNYEAVKSFFDKFEDETADMKSEFISLAEIAGMDISLFKQLSESRQLEIVQSFKTIVGDDAKEAFNELKSMFASQMLLKAFAGQDKDFVKECIEVYGEQTDVFPTIYSKLGSETNKVMAQVLGKCENEEELKKEILYYSTVYGANIQQTWKQLKDYIEANTDVFENTSGYGDAVWNKLIEELPIDEATDIADSLKEIKKKQSSSSGGGGGSSSGGGKVSANVMQVPAVQPQAPTPTAKPEATTEKTSVFPDVQGGHWACEAVEFLSGKGVVSGFNDGTFKPDDKITREQAVVIFVNAFFKLEEGTPTFTDVKEGDWFGSYLATAEKNGIVTGYDGKFGVGENIKRQDFALMLYRILLSEGEEFKGTAVEFEDNTIIADYATEAVDALSAMGYVSGKDGKFAPLDGITRAEATQMVYNVLK